MTMWTDRSGPSDESEGPALSPEERRAARQARRAAEARRLRMRRLSVTVTVTALVVVVGAVLVLRPAADVAPQTAGIASMATPAPAAPGYAADPVTSSQTQQPVVAEDAKSDQPTSTDTAEPASLPAEELPVVSEGDYGSVVAAAQRGAVDRGDGRFGIAVQRGQHRGQHRLDRRFAEFGDVGPGEEGAPGADQHHCLDRRVAGELAKTVDQGATHGDAQRIDRWIVDGDDADLGPIGIDHTNLRYADTIIDARFG